MDIVLKNIIKEKVEAISKEDNVMIVLKGIPLSIVNSNSDEKIELGEIIENKMKYFLDKIYEKRTVITYEEFLLISDFIIAQYKK